MKYKCKKAISFILTLVYIIGLNSSFVINANTIEKAPIYMMKAITDGKDQVLLNDTFEISYKFQPQDILANDMPNENVKKQKNIILIIDTSGSMDFDINGNEIKSGYYGWVEIDKDSYVKNNKNYRIESIKVTKDDNWDEKISKEVYQNSDYDYFEEREYFNWLKLRYERYKVYYKYEYYKNKYYHWEWINNNIPSRLDLVKASVENFLDQIQGMKHIKINLVEFSTNTKKTVGPYFADNNKDINVLKQEVHRLNAVGGTNLGEGMYEGYNILDNNDGKDDYLILLTDGVPTYYSYIKENNNNIDYYIGNGTAKLGGTGYNDLDKKSLNYAKYVGEYYKQNSKTKDVKSYYIAFADNDAGNKLDDIANTAGAYYKKAMTSDALSDVYDSLAKQIVSDFTINDIYFEETFPDDFEIVSYPEGMKKIGNTIKGEFGSVNYNLDSKGKYYVASPLEFKITLKPKKTGEYILGNNEFPYNSYIKYKDLDDTVETKPFVPIKINVFEDKPPIINAILTNDLENPTKAFLNINIDEDASIYIYDINDNLITKKEKGIAGNNYIELNENKLIGNYLKIVAKDKFNNVTSETVPIIILEALDYISTNNNINEAQLVIKTQLNSRVEDLIVNSILVDRNKFVDEFGKYKKTIEINNGTNIFQIKVTNEYGNSTIYNFINNMDLDKEPPVISVDYPKEFVIKSQGKDQLTIFVESNGTGSEIVETHYIKLPKDKSKATILDFSDIIGTNKNLLEVMRESEISSSKFKDNTNKDQYKHEKFTVTENGYYAIYAKDKAGNESVKVILIGNIVEVLPELL